MRNAIATTIGLVAAATVVAALAPSAGATFEGRRGRIAYAGIPKGSDQPEIFTVKKDGTGVRRLTRSGAWDSDPVWSPSGRHIAWSCHGRTVKADPPFTSDVCVMDADGGDKRRFGLERSMKTPDFSPNHKRIGFAVDGPNDTDGSGPRYPSDEIWVMGRDGSNKTRVTKNKISEAALSWSPAGGEIAFVGVTEQGRSNLYVVDLKTGDERVVASDARVASSANGHGTLYSSELDWSPDGTKIVFTRSVDQSIDVYVVDRTGENEVRVTDDPPSELNTSAAWAPDGESIVYRHASEGSSGPGWRCLVDFPVADGPVSTDHDACTFHRRSQFDYSWQPRLN